MNRSQVKISLGYQVTSVANQILCRIAMNIIRSFLVFGIILDNYVTIIAYLWSSKLFKLYFDLTESHGG